MAGTSDLERDVGRWQVTQADRCLRRQSEYPETRIVRLRSRRQAGCPTRTVGELHFARKVDAKRTPQVSANARLIDFTLLIERKCLKPPPFPFNPAVKLPDDLACPD